MRLTHKGKVHHESGSDDDNAIEKTFTKGPWTEAEDKLLTAYVEKHGDGNWNAVQKNSTLSRCGKSCRFRWLNYLRPNLKKGPLTDEEEQRVVELHAVMGNKWARMAAKMPGRTDNELKNFWNTRIKRLKRQGLPVYPNEVREKAMNAAAQSGLNTHSLDAYSSQDSMEVDSDEMRDLYFKLLPTCPCPSYYYQSMVRNVTPTTDSFMSQGQCFFQPNMYNSIAFPSGTAFPFTGEGIMNEQSLPLENYPFVESTLEHVPNIYSLDNATYYSPSRLPSFQCFDSHDQQCTSEAQQCTSESQQCDPILERPSENTLVQPPLTDQTPLNFPSSLYDGFLESVFCGSSGETDPEVLQAMSSLLGHTELPPLTSNTTGHNFNFQTDLDYFGSTS